MPKMYLKTDPEGNPIQAGILSTERKLAYTGVSAQSAALTSDVIRLVATTDCYFLCGANPTAASTTSRFLPANCPEIFCLSDTGLKVAAIQAAAPGTLHITELK